jgi:hypothetical protein
MLMERALGGTPGGGGLTKDNPSRLLSCIRTLVGFTTILALLALVVVVLSMAECETKATALHHHVEALTEDFNALSRRYNRLVREVDQLSHEWIWHAANHTLERIGPLIPTPVAGTNGTQSSA